MELWIRSQDKESLIKIDNLGCIENRIVFIPNRPTGGRLTIGRYKTRERALEILDEIQENIIKQGQVIILTDEKGIPNGSKFFSYVYEMPEE